MVGLGHRTLKALSQYHPEIILAHVIAMHNAVLWLIVWLVEKIDSILKFDICILRIHQRVVYYLSELL